MASLPERRSYHAPVPHRGNRRRCVFSEFGLRYRRRLGRYKKEKNVNIWSALKTVGCSMLLLVSMLPRSGLAADGKIEVWWLGNAATRIKTVTGKVIVIDPYLLKNPKTPEQYRNLDALGKVDLI